MPETVNMKSVLLTFITTLAALAFASTFFLNTLLGTFGLAATSIDTINNLKSSQIVIDKMKTRHHIKKQAQFQTTTFILKSKPTGNFPPNPTPPIQPILSHLSQGRPLTPSVRPRAPPPLRITLPNKN